MLWGSGATNQSKQIRAVQISRKRHWNQLVAMPDSGGSGSEGSQVLPRKTKRGNSKQDASPSCGPFPHKWIVMDSYSSSQVDFLASWFVASTKFLVDDDIAVVAAEDDAMVSLITDVSMVLQMAHPRVVRGDLGSAERVTKTSARICTPWVLLGGVTMFQGIGDHTARECNGLGRF